MDSKHKQKLYQIKKHKEELLKAEAEISLTAILNSEKFQAIMTGCREFRERLYTPLKTLFIFIKQVLSTDKSCRHAVAGGTETFLRFAATCLFIEQYIQESMEASRYLIFKIIF